MSKRKNEKKAMKTTNTYKYKQYTKNIPDSPRAAPIIQQIYKTYNARLTTHKKTLSTGTKKQIEHQKLKLNTHFGCIWNKNNENRF